MCVTVSVTIYDPTVTVPGLVSTIGCTFDKAKASYVAGFPVPLPLPLGPPVRLD